MWRKGRSVRHAYAHTHIDLRIRRLMRPLETQTIITLCGCHRLTHRPIRIQPRVPWNQLRLPGRVFMLKLAGHFGSLALERKSPAPHMPPTEPPPMRGMHPGHESLSREARAAAGRRNQESCAEP